MLSSPVVESLREQQKARKAVGAGQEGHDYLKFSSVASAFAGRDLPAQKMAS